MHASKKRINIADILGNIFKESIDSARKKSKRIVEADDSDPFGTKDEEKDDESNEASEDIFGSEDGDSDKAEKEVKNDSKDTEKLKKGDVSVDDVIEKLNAIRSGKSYKDEEILKKLTDYFDKLESAEKTALLAFLKGLSQIVTGEVASEDIVKPADKPADVKIEKSVSNKKVKITPTVIKKQSPDEDKEEKTPAEDTKGPVPITAKKK